MPADVLEAAPGRRMGSLDRDSVQTTICIRNNVRVPGSIPLTCLTACRETTYVLCIRETVQVIERSMVAAWKLHLVIVVQDAVQCLSSGQMYHVDWKFESAVSLKRKFKNSVELGISSENSAIGILSKQTKLLRSLWKDTCTFNIQQVHYRPTNLK